jgi:hypothetical protein
MPEKSGNLGPAYAWVEAGHLLVRVAVNKGFNINHTHFGAPCIDIHHFIIRDSHNLVPLD